MRMCKSFASFSDLVRLRTRLQERACTCASIRDPLIEQLGQIWSVMSLGKCSFPQLPSVCVNQMANVNMPQQPQMGIGCQTETTPGPGRRPVLVTLSRAPGHVYVSWGPSTTPTDIQPLDKVIVKAEVKAGKTSKVFTLCTIDTKAVFFSGRFGPSN